MAFAVLDFCGKRAQVIGFICAFSDACCLNGQRGRTSVPLIAKVQSGDNAMPLDGV